VKPRRHVSKKTACLSKSPTPVKKKERSRGRWAVTLPGRRFFQKHGRRRAPGQEVFKKPPVTTGKKRKTMRGWGKDITWGEFFSKPPSCWAARARLRRFCHGAAQFGRWLLRLDRQIGLHAVQLGSAGVCSRLVADAAAGIKDEAGS